MSAEPLGFSTGPSVVERPSILVVEDDPRIRESLSGVPPPPRGPVGPPRRARLPSPDGHVGRAGPRDAQRGEPGPGADRRAPGRDEWHRALRADQGRYALRADAGGDPDRGR